MSFVFFFFVRLKIFLVCFVNFILLVVELFLDFLVLFLELILFLELGVDLYFFCISWVFKVWDVGGYCSFFGYSIDWLEVKEGV